MIDFLIAGQGIAGSLLAARLINRGASVLIADPGFPVTSSRIAAGILHPVTGRRIVKSWMADTLIPYAVDFYSSLRIGCFNSHPILEIFTSVQQRNEWISKSSEPGMEHWIGNILPEQPGTSMPFGGILINHTGWVDTNVLIGFYRDQFDKKDQLIIDEVQDQDVEYFKDHVRWKNIEAGKIIFCNGWKAATSGMFSYLPFVPAKGEILEIECHGLEEKYILNRNIYMIPLGDGKFKTGATYNWKELDEEPTTEGKVFLEECIRKITSLPFQVTSQYAAVRPANKDRRPFIGMQKNTAGIFNGLGTKGLMLTPYFADHFADHLLSGKNLMEEVSIERYRHLLSGHSAKQ